MRLSYDLPFLFAPKSKIADVVIIKMDEQSHRELRQDYGKMWDRSLHARLLNQLKSDGARLAVFDVFFADAGPPATDQALADAITNHGRVVLAADRVPISHPNFPGAQTVLPVPILLSAAGTNWGISRVDDKEADGRIRKHYVGTSDDPSLAWAAAQAYGATPTKNPEQRLTQRWIRYYGPNGTIESLSYYHTLNMAPGSFRDKIVFIGGKPFTDFTGSAKDEFPTPFTRWGGQLTPGVEIHATMFLNLVREDWLTRLAPGFDLLAVVLAGVIFGYAFSLLRPLAGCGWASLSMLGVSAFAVLLFWKQRIWFDWALIASVQIPIAWASAAVLYTRKLFREKEDWKRKVETVKLEQDMAAPGPLAREELPAQSSFLIPDHTLLRNVGAGSFGEVWLARNAIGTYHAVKVIQRRKFKNDESYEREFKGIQNYMPLSLRHTGLVPILQVGRNDAAGYYYCVMEAGDDEVSGQGIVPETYSPRTLAKELQKHGNLTVKDCILLALTLARSLEFLHTQQLVHRDIKPSNIIYSNGLPKLADIGLVREMVGAGEARTYVGTEGFIAPEGPGTAAADIYSLGKVMYEAAMGRDRLQFPDLPTTFEARPDGVELVQLNEIILKACENDAQLRYQSAAELRTDLLRLRADLDRAAKK